MWQMKQETFFNCHYHDLYYLSLFSIKRKLIVPIHFKIYRIRSPLFGLQLKSFLLSVMQFGQGYNRFKTT